MKKPVPLILDTDIGSDIDDTWALAMILRSPELDLRMVVSAAFDTPYQAKLAAKMLQIGGREDIPVGIGIPGSGDMEANSNIRDWVEDYDLSSYPNVYEDGVGAMIDLIMNAEEKITVLAIGPCTNLAAAIEREPRITEKSRLVFLGANLYNGAVKGWYPPLGKESNINVSIAAYRTGVEKNDWDVELIPLDVSGFTILDADYFNHIRETAKNDPLLAALVENTDIWFKNMNYNYHGPTSGLFDTVGVYALISKDLLNYEKLPVYVNDNGLSLIDPMRGKMMDCATSWKDKEKFYKFLTARLCGEI